LLFFFIQKKCYSYIVGWELFSPIVKLWRKWVIDRSLEFIQFSDWWIKNYQNISCHQFWDHYSLDNYIQPLLEILNGEYSLNCSNCKDPQKEFLRRFSLDRDRSLSRIHPMNYDPALRFAKVLPDLFDFRQTKNENNIHL